VGAPVLVDAVVYDLHRRAKDQSDEYGSDLALTVVMRSTGLVKTAFFQLKVSKSLKCRLERKQLVSSQQDSMIAPRSFVFAADVLTAETRIISTGQALRQFTSAGKTKAFSIVPWNRTRNWIAEWLDCRQAPPSDLRSLNRVESLLLPFVVDTPLPGFLNDLESPAIRNGPDEPAPARRWIILELADYIPGTLG
jgi:hypothetical protein